MSNIIPAKNYVLLKPLGERQTASKLYVPEKQGNKPEMGIVYKVGSGEQPFPKGVTMESEDIVIHKKYMSNEMEIPELSEKLNPIAFEDIVALIKGSGSDA